MLSLKYKYGKLCHRTEVAVLVENLKTTTLKFSNHEQDGYIIVMIEDATEALSELLTIIKEAASGKVEIPESCEELYDSEIYNAGHIIMACSVLIQDIIKQLDEALYIIKGW